MSRIKLSNEVFNLGLNQKELAVFAYMSSLPALDNLITIKQSTIAQKCGIKAVQTVSKIISSLEDIGLVVRYSRHIKDNRHNGTYIYRINKLDTNKSFFFFERHVFGLLNARQLTVYLFMCKSYSTVIKRCWNSYNDISKQIHMKRETVIQTVQELCKLKLIVKIKRKSKKNKRINVDNHYQIIFVVHMKIKKRPFPKKRNGRKKIKIYLDIKYDNTRGMKCQQFAIRGSPSD
ncbi:MAG: hypothetical protein Q4F95_02120 [Oscillospiraceae bacterium]|nr:hypothetical protein [Oscillospiraceae bacterium]